MTDTEREALCARIDELCAENERLRQERSEYQATIDSLVDECTDHKAENAKLVVKLNTEHIVRQNMEIENTKLREQYEAVIADYRSEVAKLRKLANGYEALTEILCNERECDGCPFDGTEQIVCEHMRLQTCLRELGIEVE